MSFPPIGGLAAGMTRRRYAVLADEDRQLIARLRRETALPIAAIAALVCTTDSAVVRICKELAVIPQYSAAPYRRRIERAAIPAEAAIP